MFPRRGFFPRCPPNRRRPVADLPWRDTAGPLAATNRHSGAAKRNPESSVFAQTPLDSRVRGNDGSGH